LRILLATYAFAPSIGGLQTASLVLAQGLSERGYDVTVVTATPAAREDEYRFRVVRRPGPAAMLRLVQDADVAWQNQISLRLLWPLAFVPRPLVFMHHAILEDNAVIGARFTALKRLLCRFGHNGFVSSALQRTLGLPGPVIPNAYDETTYRLMPDVPRDRDIAFLGRLEPYKGVDTLLDALAILAARNMHPAATVIGAGPEEDALKARAASAGLSAQVDFAGPQHGEELARLLNRHRVLVVPSRTFEGLPMVVLEALACGCVVVGTDLGGLPEAIGPCGPVVRPNDPAALADTLAALLSDPDALAAYRRRAPAHLTKFTKASYLDACERLIRDAAANRSTAARLLAPKA
jgi:glycosyltransferase involved in cell wall biosynthesis